MLVTVTVDVTVDVTVSTGDIVAVGNEVTVLVRVLLGVRDEVNEGVPDPLTVDEGESVPLTVMVTVDVTVTVTLALWLELPVGVTDAVADRLKEELAVGESLGVCVRVSELVEVLVLEADPVMVADAELEGVLVAV